MVGDPWAADEDWTQFRRFAVDLLTTRA